MYTPNEDALLVERYANTLSSELAVIIGVSERSIYNRARKLGLRKSREHIVLIGKMSSNHPDSIEHRFKKGHIPANKGQRMPDEIYAKCKATMFHKGNIPPNKVSVGTEIIESKDGYVKVKTAEPNVWEYKHRLVWQENNGAIPEGFIIQFRNGNRTDCRIENLYMISRAEQLRTQNSLAARYPEELRSLIYLKGSLKRRITMFNRKHNEQ